MEPQDAADKAAERSGTAGRRAGEISERLTRLAAGQRSGADDVTEARRHAEELHGLIEDMIRVLETRVQPDLRRGRYPDRRTCKLAAEVVRAVARDLDG